MALQNFDQQILNKLGDTLGGDIGVTQGMMDDWCTQATRAIVNRVTVYNPLKLWVFGSETTLVNGTGLAIGTTKSAHILSVERLKAGSYKYPCTFHPAELFGQMLNPDSPEYCYDIDPGCVLKNATLLVAPVPTATDIAYISYVKHPATIDASAVATVNGSDSCTFPVDP